METLTATSADGSVIGCELLGAGPPLLVIHGSGGDRSRWTAVRERLAASFRVHLMDRRGRGLSKDEAANGYALEREAEDIRALVEAIGAPVLVLAHSYGGACALEAATDCGGIERLLVYEPALSTAEGLLNDPEPLGRIDAALARGDNEAALTIFLGDILELDDAALDAMRDSPLWQSRLAAIAKFSREAHAANDYVAESGRLASIEAPMRLLLGTESTLPLTRAARAVHVAVPGSELRELQGHAHAAMDADPEMFAAEVRDWLGAAA